MKRNIMVMLVLLLMFALAVPVFAARVEKETWSSVEDYTLIEDCGDYGEGWNFAVKDIDSESGSITYWYDNDDVLIKSNYQETGTDTLYREGFPENVVTGPYHFNYKTDEVTGDVKINGTVWNLHLPGEGNVYKVAGTRFALDFYTAVDRTVGLMHLDVEAICRYFAD